MYVRMLGSTLLAAASVCICSARAAEKTELPALDCTVLFSHGSFHSYSTIPAAGDKLVFDVGKLTDSKKTHMVAFTPSKKVPGPPPYIPLLGPLVLLPSSGKAPVSYRLLSANKRFKDTRLTIDLHKPRSGTNVWTIYIVYESRGVVEGIAILKGNQTKPGSG